MVDMTGCRCQHQLPLRHARLPDESSDHPEPARVHMSYATKIEDHSAVPRQHIGDGSSKMTRSRAMEDLAAADHNSGAV
jgi:hypothetical protein